jgi:hypothetical protein
MARFAGTKRQAYTTERVRKMRNERAFVKAKKDGVSNEQVQAYLGKLQAAGHMKINGFRGMNIENTMSTPDPFAQSLGVSGGITKHIKLDYQIYNQNGMDDSPHFAGYLRSASESDKQYRLKGWFNEDGTIRLELVN